jgi:hypothetical protein
MAKVFNCTPKPAMLRSVQNERWTVTGALAELIDNSFGSGRGNATAVTIFHDTGSRSLTVLDNGRGMDAVGRLFQHGNSIGHSIGDIGEYGAGGTKALLWLASKVSIWTLHDHKVQHDQVTWSEWFGLKSFDDANVSNEWYEANRSNTPPELLAIRHGTLIRLHLLATRAFRANNTVRDLASSRTMASKRRCRMTTCSRSEARVWHPRNGRAGRAARSGSYDYEPGKDAPASRAPEEGHGMSALPPKAAAAVGGRRGS